MIPATSDFNQALCVFEIFNQHLKALLLANASHQIDSSDLLLAEPMRFLYPCMIIIRISQLNRARSSLPPRLLEIEATNIHREIAKCFEGDMELRYSKQAVQAYNVLKQQLLTSI